MKKGKYLTILEKPYLNHSKRKVIRVRVKLLSNMILFTLKDTVDKVSREEQCGFRKGKGCVNQIFAC